MSSPETEKWLAAMQARFSGVLRTPLDHSGGRLRANPTRYPDAARADIKPSAQLTNGERLSVYHRQYWMRLFNVLHAQYPLTMRLVGPWFFNQYATRFLLARPPRQHDLGEIAEGFDEFLAGALKADPVRHAPRGPTLPRAALLESARLDATYRRVFLAPEEPAFRVSAQEEADLPSRRLRFSRAVALVTEYWPLLELRGHVLRAPGETAVALPARLAQPKQWAIARAPRGVVHIELAPQQARMLTLLQTHEVGHALSILEEECPESARSSLAQHVQGYFAHATSAGWFSGWRDP
ncbi:MAG: hypothetical protein RLZZ450_4691 [Pseudomonadota bacterium]